MTVNYIYRNTVQPSWIDHNNHMHDAQYYAVFSDSVVAFFEAMDFSVSRRKDQNITIFSLEAHITFLKELLLDESFYVQPHIYDYDAKRVHLFLSMYNALDEPIATYEIIMMAVNYQTRKSTIFPEDILTTIQQQYETQAAFTPPKQLGHVIQIPRK